MDLTYNNYHIIFNQAFGPGLQVVSMDTALDYWGVTIAYLDSGSSDNQTNMQGIGYKTSEISCAHKINYQETVFCGNLFFLSGDLTSATLRYLKGDYLDYHQTCYYDY